MRGWLKICTLLLPALFFAGCATTYVPISWGFGDKVQELSRSDVFLKTLFDRYDPSRRTLRVAGSSFDEVMMPSQVKYHLGAYRPDTQLIYRSLYQEYGTQQLRTLMLHELSHHIWFTAMNDSKRERWRAHLQRNPSPLQGMVRRVYARSADYDTEDFAFTVEFARPVDVEALADLEIITPAERDAILVEKNFAQADAFSAGHVRVFSAVPLTVAAPSGGAPKGTDTTK